MTQKFEHKQKRKKVQLAYLCSIFSEQQSTNCALMNVAWNYNESRNMGVDSTKLKVSDFHAVRVSITKS